tara:strand:- start:6166 stop:7155 length:990 start_codon:yes stop_codon:yes gene_type:complete
MATESSITDTYGPLLTTTLKRVLDSGALHDNIFNNDVLLQWLRSGNRVKTVDGGERMRVGIMDTKNTTAKWYADYESLDVTAQSGMTSAFYTWKQGSTSVSVNGKELRANKGKSRITNLQQEKISQAAASLVDIVATGAFSDGSGTGSKQMTGLEAMIEDTPLTAAYAGIPVGNTAWANQVSGNVGAAAVNLLPSLRTVYNDCKQGKGGANSGPDLLLTTQSIHESFEALMYPQVRYQPNPSSGADAGIEKLKFKGADVVWDDYCTSGKMYVLNSNHITMFVHSDANFSMAEGGFQKPINQDALVTQIFFQGNLSTDNRRKQGKLKAIT